MFTSSFLKMFSGKTFSWTKFKLHITKITLLCLTLSKQKIMFEVRIYLKIHLPNQLSLVLMLSTILISIRVLRPLYSVQHELLIFFLLLGSPLHHHYIDILNRKSLKNWSLELVLSTDLIEQDCPSHEELCRVLLYLPLLSRIL